MRVDGSRIRKEKDTCGRGLRYNIAGRAAQSNSVYVSVLKIPIVHADSVRTSLRQNCFVFFARAAFVSEGENIVFRNNSRIHIRGRETRQTGNPSDEFPVLV